MNNSKTSLIPAALLLLVFHGSMLFHTVHGEKNENPIQTVKTKFDSTSHEDWIQGVERLLDLLTLHPKKHDVKQWLEKALDRMDRIIDENPKHVEALYERSKVGGRLAKKSGIRQSVSLARQVRKDAETCLDLKPKHTGCLTVLGVWHHDLSQGVYSLIFDANSEKALPLVRKALKHSDDPIAIQYELAKILYDREKTDELQSVVKRMRKQEPETKLEKHYLKKAEKLLRQ